MNHKRTPGLLKTLGGHVCLNFNRPFALAPRQLLDVK